MPDDVTGERAEGGTAPEHAVSVSQNIKPRKPWLIAAWPGMGNVAVIAAGYLIQQLEMYADGELLAFDHFDVEEIDVKDGLTAPVQLPRGYFFRSNLAQGERDLLVFVSEKQPTQQKFGYARELIAEASNRGVERVITFASMASALHPAENSRVAGFATSVDALAELRRAEVRPLDEGQIGGLNGIVLAAAAERGMSGVCLLAEIPFFAAGVPNPKAARSALSVFSVLAGIDVSLDDLDRQSTAMDRLLIQVYEKLEAQSGGDSDESDDASEEDDGGDDDENGDSIDESAPAPTENEAPPAQPEDPTAAPSESDEAPAVRPKPPLEQTKLSAADRQRLERLFDDARKDASRAVRLKEELDRLAVFAEYENRFLDLFRRGT